MGKYIGDWEIKRDFRVLFKYSLKIVEKKGESWCLQFVSARVQFLSGAVDKNLEPSA